MKKIIARENKKNKQIEYLTLKIKEEKHCWDKSLRNAYDWKNKIIAEKLIKTMNTSELFNKHYNYFFMILDLSN